MNTTLSKIFDRKHDPVYSCEVYRAEGCSFVDGLLCDFPECSMRADYCTANCPKITPVSWRDLKRKYMRKLKRCWDNCTGARARRYAFSLDRQILRMALTQIDECDRILENPDSAPYRDRLLQLRTNFETARDAAITRMMAYITRSSQCPTFLPTTCGSAK